MHRPPRPSSTTQANRRVLGSVHTGPSGTANSANCKALERKNPLDPGSLGRHPIIPCHDLGSVAVNYLDVVKSLLRDGSWLAWPRLVSPGPQDMNMTKATNDQPGTGEDIWLGFGHLNVCAINVHHHHLHHHHCCVHPSISVPA